MYCNNKNLSTDKKHKIKINLSVAIRRYYVDKFKTIMKINTNK